MILLVLIAFLIGNVHCLDETSCPDSNHSRLDITFNRDHIGVGFIPHVSFDPYILSELNEDDVNVFLRKIHTKFDHILVTYLKRFEKTRVDWLETRNEFSSLNNYVLAAAAYFNGELSPQDRPLRVTFAVSIDSIKAEGARVLKYLRVIAATSKAHAPNTLERMLINFGSRVDNSSFQEFSTFLTHFNIFIEKNWIRNYEKGVIITDGSCTGDYEWFFHQLLMGTGIKIIYIHATIEFFLVPSEIIASPYLNSFELCKKHIQKYYPGVRIGLMTKFPDTYPDGSANYTTFVNFWRFMNKWAGEGNVSVFFDQAFDIPALTNLPNTGWWRLIPDGSYKNASDFRFEDKLCLQNRVVGNEFERVDLNWLKKGVIFNKEYVGTHVDLAAISALEYTNMTSLDFEKLMLIVGEKFRFISVVYRHPPYLQHLEGIANLKKDKNLSLDTTLIFEKIHLNSLLNTSDRMNEIAPGIVKTLLFSPLVFNSYELWEAIEFLWDKKSNISASFRYSWGLIFDIKMCTPAVFNLLKNESGSWDMLVFSTIINPNIAKKDYEMIGVEMKAKRQLARFESCKRRVKDFKGMEETEAVFMTGWKTKEDKDFLDATTFWDKINDWASRTKTRVFLYEAIDNPTLESDSTGNSFKYGWWKLTSPEKVEGNDEIALRIAEGIQKRTELLSKRFENIGIVFGIISVLIGISILTAYFLRKKKLSYLTKEDLENFFKGTGVDEDNEEGVGYNQTLFEIVKSAFKIDHKLVLGSGEFGKVCKGSVKKDGIEMQVAVKMTKKNCSRPALQGLLSEIKVLGYLGKHGNVVELIGAHTAELKRSVLFVFLEFCELGSLESYLRKWDSEDKTIRKGQEAGQEIEMSVFNNDKEELKSDMKGWAYEIANGMEFITKKGIVHMDLATRNVLLSSSKTAKISDFGLSRRLDSYQMYIKNGTEPLPWRWMAPESLKRAEFTEKSDVWAFGVTLWEICSLAEIPYPGLEWDPNFATFLENGIRLGTTKFNPNDMQKVMQRCWAIDPDARPTFNELKIELKSNVDVNKQESDKIISTSTPIYDVLE